MDDGERKRLARLKDDERRRSARQSAMHRMLSRTTPRSRTRLPLSNRPEGRQDPRCLGDQRCWGRTKVPAGGADRRRAPVPATAIHLDALSGA